MPGSNIDRIMSGVLYLGKKAAQVIMKLNSGVLEIKNAADNAYAKLRAASIVTGAGANDVTTLENLQGRLPNIGFSFEGASAPAPGANTGKYGFCKTSGGSYTAGDVVYDDGVALTKQPSEVCRAITTAVAVSGGTVSLIQNGFYVLQDGAWTLKGDGGSSGSGQINVIEVAFTKDSGTVNSTATIPSGAVVMRVDVDVETIFDGTAPTLAVTVAGSTPVTISGTTDNDLKDAVLQMNFINAEIGADNTGVVRLTVVPDSSTTGAGKVRVSYVTPLA